MRLPTASKLSLAHSCKYPWTDGAVWGDDEPGEAAQRGTRIHALAARLLDAKAPHPGELARDEKDAAQHAVEAIDALTGGIPPRAEVAVGYDHTTGLGVLLGYHLGRDYGAAGRSMIVGSADVAWRDGDTIHVADIKTGSRDHVEPAATNAQLAGLAVMLASASDAKAARVHLVFADAAGAVVESHDLDALDLDAEAARLRAMVAAIPDAKPTPGDHCRYCPARGSCPATSAALAEATPDAADVLPLSAEITTPEHAARVYGVIKLAKLATDALDERLRAFVTAHGPIALPSGKRLRMVDGTRETIAWSEEDKAAARAAGRVKVSTFTSMKETK